MNRCKVSIIVPVRNGELFLGQCLDSVLAQTWTSFELLIVNDASRDNSADIISRYLQDERIRTIDLKEHQGVSVARNRGIEVATGQYVIFLDADDYWNDESMLENLLGRADSELADLVSFGFKRIDENGKQLGVKTKSSATIDLCRQNDWHVEYNIWAKLISRQLLIINTIKFDASLEIGEDALFSIALYCHARKLVICEAAYYCYRLNSHSATQAQWDSNKIFDTVRWCQKAIPVIQNSPLFERRPEVLQSLILERLTMLHSQLGVQAINVLSEVELRQYFAIWELCLQHLEPTTLQQIEKSPQQRQLSEMVALVEINDIAALQTFFNKKVKADKRLPSRQTVNLSRQQAKTIGENLLRVDKAEIRCNFGCNVIVTLTRSEAHSLAQKLIENRKAEITLNFN